MPSGDLAFIEQRAHPYTASELVSINEKYFTSLSKAKAYVNDHFFSGAEYFSLAQSEHAENILYTLVDKITYLMA
ncbi:MULTISPECIES: hypothetical protein [Dyadobacter]|uniref:Uncharacterized protein n=2 Tax=Dyadobacter TaxID=120831 RepID=A0A5R9KML8_9BACT|nr:MULTISPECIES: hypothetical protein [Dyadobacter]KAA6439741.1 hypothetical protein FEM33_10690 [Dyadobacter flavalbus]TLU97471.1 hypothetical protein FEM55_00430 [Dyadobacter sediminis]GGC15503.1 hypothetical protein GCM10011325_47920 [Dyadobacter sediminis]